MFPVLEWHPWDILCKHMLAQMLAVILAVFYIHRSHLILRGSLCQAAGSHTPTWQSMRGPRLFARHLFRTPSSCLMLAHLQGKHVILKGH